MAKILWKPLHPLFPWQQRVDASPKRFKVVKGGRRAGKTHYANRWQSIKALEMPPGEHMYVASTQKQAYEISWDEYLDQLGPDVIGRVNERDHRITLKNKAKIILRGSDKLDLQRGKKYRSLVMEEAAFQKSQVWERIFEPTLIDYLSPALFISSPKKGWFTRLYDKYADGHDKNWDCFKFTIYDNPLLSKEEIERIRANTSDATFKTEYMAEELETEGQVYTEFDPVKHSFVISDRWPAYRQYPCVVGVDWGLDDKTGVVWLNFTPEGYCIVSREHVQGGWDVRRHAEVISRAAHDFDAKREHYVMDQSAFRREGGSMSTVADLFKEQMGFYFQRSYKGSLDFGVDIVKRFLRGDGVTPWLYVSNNCPEVIDAFNSWEHNQHETDILAALRYGLVHAVQRRVTTLHERLDSLRTDFTPRPPLIGELLAIKKEKARQGAQWSFDDEYGVPHADFNEI
jgi:hypothetical protein